MGFRRWMLLLPVCALPLWALVLFTRQERPKAAFESAAPAPRPTREIARQAVGRPVEIDPALPRTPGANGPLELQATDSQRALAQGHFEQQRQALELRNSERFARAGAAFEAAPFGEPRQREAAIAREQRLREALVADGAKDRVRRVECRPPLCKLEVAAPEPMAEPLGSGLHFIREAGVQTATAFRGEGQTRALTIYVLDEAASFDALSVPAR